MGRRVRDSNLDNREGRLKLTRRHRPYWRLISTGQHLGYRKGKNGGVWMGREYQGDGEYRVWRIGVADDIIDADGERTLSFKQAQDAVKEGPKGHRGDLDTVADVMNYYMDYQRAERKSPESAEFAIEAHIKPTLGRVKIVNLSADAIREWRDNLAVFTHAEENSLKKKLTAFKAEFSELQRRRKATSNRVLSILKAALNYAEREGKYKGKTPWRRVKPFKNVEFTDHRYLQEDEVIRLINACESDFRDLVRGAIQTGCRYGELAGMLVKHYNRDSKTIALGRTKGGKPRHAYLTDAGVELFDELIAGKGGSEHIFLRADGEPWNKSQQSRRIKEACGNAKITPPISFKGLRTTYGSTLARAGTPLQVIAAAMGHASTRITEQHYAHLMPDYVSDTIRQNLPSFGQGRSKVKRLRQRSK